MIIRLLILVSCFFVHGCVQAPVFKEGDFAQVRSNYPIVNVNGAEVPPAYALDIEAGENTLVIIYNTYQYDYHCTFSWQAVAQTAYEVTDQENRQPLTLYRWLRKNGMWAIRMDPVDPIQCIRVSPQE